MKIILQLLIIFICFETYGQTQAKKTLVSVDSDLASLISFDNFNSSTEFNAGANIGSNVGYFINERIAIGGYLTFFLFINSSDGSRYKGDIFLSAGPFFRVYLSESNVKPYISMETGYFYNPEHGLIATPGFGLAYYLNESISIDAGIDLSYEYIWNKESYFNVNTKIGISKLF